jgi:hypothetical protein
VLKGIHLTLLVGPVVAVPAPQPVVDALTSAQVTTSSGQRSGFQLTFSVAKGSLLETTLLPVGYFDPGIRVILMATINGIPNVLMDGIVTRQDMAPSNDVGASTVTVTGEDVSVMMDLIEIPGFPFPALPDFARVEVIVAKYALFGLIPLVIPSALVDVPIPIAEIPSQSGTDLAYVNELARKAGYVFYVDSGPVPGVNVAYWGPEIRIGVPQPALNVNMDAETNVESLSFGFDGLSQEQVVVFIQEPISKIPIPIPIPSVSLLKPPLALKPAPKLRLKFLTDTAKLNPVKAALVGLAEAAGGADAVTGNGQLDVLRYGRVLKARGLVGVRGAGSSYDGLYFVKSVTHQIKPGEYKQSFQLAREGLISITPVVPS